MTNNIVKFLSKLLSLAKKILRILFLGTKRFIKWLFSKEGLTIALLAGILANLISSQIRDKIQQQRYLEMLQYEMRLQATRANLVFNDFIDDQVIVDDYYFINDVYLAGMESGYLLTIEPDISVKIATFYEVLPRSNAKLEEYYSAISKSYLQWEECMFESSETGGSVEYLCKGEEALLNRSKKFYSELILETWNSNFNLIVEILKRFDPASNRSKSLILKLFMGSKNMWELE